MAYTRPDNPMVAQAVEALDDDAREFFEERAAILEFEAHMPRPDAETLALTETRSYIVHRCS